MPTATLEAPPMQVFDHKRMRALRESAGLTQAQAAKLTAMSVSR